ncbi:teicoplanin resistance protein VanZ, partial [Burkholderia pseudomallei]|nr:teicoplanin resistance protein VanZ [Burkholderia pseudomallei]
VASNLDLAANALGTLLDAALVAPATGALLERGVLRRLRFAWFEADGATPLLLAVLWPFAIVFPSPFLFGIGDWPATLWERADVSMQDALLAWLPAAWQVTDWPQRVDGWLSDSAWEAVLGGLMLFPALAVASLAMRPRAPRVRLLIAFVATTLVLKSAATYMQSATGLVVVWATPGARLGIELGFAAALVALYVPGAWRAALAAAALCAG